jgi:hypothetical protein
LGEVLYASERKLTVSSVFFDEGPEYPIGNGFSGKPVVLIQSNLERVQLKGLSDIFVAPHCLGSLGSWSSFTFMRDPMETPVAQLPIVPCAQVWHERPEIWSYGSGP